MVVSDSKYVLDESISDYPLPLDICMHSSDDYIVYSCDTTVTPFQLIKANHTSHAQCTVQNPIVSHYTHNQSLLTFSCIGQNNYVKLSNQTYFVTNLCYGNIKYECDPYYAYTLSCLNSNDTQTNIAMADCVQNNSSIYTHISDHERNALYALLQTMDGKCVLSTQKSGKSSDKSCEIRIGDTHKIESISFLNTEIVSLAMICDFPYLKTLTIIGMSDTLALPECTLLFLEDLTLINTNIYGNITAMIASVNSLNKLYLNNNPNMFGHIPSVSECNLTQLSIVNMAQMSGTIPHCALCNSELQTFDIRNTRIGQTIPLCFSELKPFLETLIIANTSFKGLLPALPFSSALNIINFGYNAFEGDLSEIFANYYMRNSTETMNHKLWCLLLNNNQFKSDNFYDFMQFMYREWSEIEIFSISNNLWVNGELFINSSLNSNKSLPLHSDKQVFIAHNCDITGDLSHILHTPFNLEYLTLFNNRMSGPLPQYISSASHDSLIPVVLLGNVLHISHGRSALPDWMSNSPFSSQTNLYSVQFQLIISILLLLIAVIGLKFNLFSIIKHIIKHKRAESVLVDERLFFRKIEFIHWKFGSIAILFCCVALSVFYPFNSGYYKYIKIESLFTINWYYNRYKIMDLGLCIASITFQLIVINMSMKLVTEINKLKSNEQSIHKQQSFEIIAPLKGVQKCKAFLLFLVNIFIYFFGCVYIWNYFIILSLPAQNTLNISANVSSFMAYSMALYLMLFTKYSIRNLMDSFVAIMEWQQFYKFYQKSIISLHYITCVIIPFVGALIFLQSCGRNWVHFWDKCADNTYMSVSVLTDYDRFNAFSVGMDNEDLCESVSFLKINWNKCIRSFLYNWSFIVLYKVIYGALGSILGLIWRLFKFRFFPFIKANRKFRLNIARYNTKIMTNLIISITFAFVSPLIIPIYLLGLITIKHLHKFMIKKYDLQFYALNNEENIYYLPINLVILGIVTNQCLAILFLFLCVESTFVGIMLFVSLLLMDFAVMKNIYTNNKLLNADIKLIEANENEEKGPQTINRKLSLINENEEREYKDETSNDDLIQMEMVNMKNYHKWVKDNGNTSISVANYGQKTHNSKAGNLSLVSNDSMVNTLNYHKYIQNETKEDYNIHAQNQSESEMQNYAIEI